MDITEQTSALKCLYCETLRKVYTDNFQLKLASIINKEDHDKDFDTQLDIVEGLSTLTEAAMTSGNPRRALHYCIMLSYAIDRLQMKVSGYQSENFKLFQKGL